MDKIYKIKSPMKYWIGHGIFILALSAASIHRLNMQFFIFLYLGILLWYAFSHKFVLDFNSKKIIEKAYGLKFKTINVDDIKEYFVKEPKNISPLVKAKPLSCLVSLRLKSAKGEEMRQFLWNITQDDALDLLAEAAKINTEIISAKESFYDNNLYKEHQAKYLLYVLIPIVLVVILYFMYLLNQGLNP